MMKKCVFCEIVNGNIHAAIVFETDEFLSFMDKYPLNRGHLLVIPKQHHEFLTNMNNNEVAELFKLVNMISKYLWKLVKADGLSIGQSNGKAASQDIFHVHVHIIPRFDNDSDGGSWPTRKTFTRKELEELASLLKAKLS